MTSMAPDTDPNKLYAHSMMHFGVAGGSQIKEEVWSLEIYLNAQISMAGVTLPNATSSTQHALSFCPFQDYLPPMLSMSNHHLHSGGLPVTSFTEYNGGDMIYQPVEERVDCSNPNIGLSLTQQTYYSSMDTAASFNNILWKSRFGHRRGCKADGCKANLLNTKRYHRRHKVCEFHSKASVVVVGGGKCSVNSAVGSVHFITALSLFCEAWGILEGLKQCYLKGYCGICVKTDNMLLKEILVDKVVCPIGCSESYT